MTLTGKTRITDASHPLPPSTSRAQAKKLRHKLLGGSLTLLAGSGLVGITNLVYNLVTARLLGPTGFAHVTAVYTLLMLASAITLSFQVVCAKYVASHESADDKAKIFNALHLRGWIAGVAIGFLLFLFNRALMHYLNLPDPVLISLRTGTAFYIPGSAARIHPGSARLQFSGRELHAGRSGPIGRSLLAHPPGTRRQGAVLASVIAVIASYFLASLQTSRWTLTNSRHVPIAFGEGPASDRFSPVR
jgi:hypothetical protein